jgi:hypothetical protein
MQLPHVVVVKVLQYKKRRNKQREEFRETMGQMLFTFIFIMLQIIGVYIIFADQL